MCVHMRKYKFFFTHLRDRQCTSFFTVFRYLIYLSLYTKHYPFCVTLSVYKICLISRHLPLLPLSLWEVFLRSMTVSPPLPLSNILSRGTKYDAFKKCPYITVLVVPEPLNFGDKVLITFFVQIFIWIIIIKNSERAP